MILRTLNMGSLLDTLSKALCGLELIEIQGSIKGTDSHAQLDVKMGKTLTTMILEKSSSAVRFYFAHNKGCAIICNFVDKFYSKYEVFVFLLNRIITVYDNDGSKDKVNKDYVVSIELLTLQKIFKKMRSEVDAKTNQELVDACGSNTYEQLLINAHIHSFLPIMQSCYGTCSELVFAFTGYTPFTVSLLTYNGIVCGYRFHTSIRGVDCYYDVDSDVAEKNGIFDIVISGEEVLSRYNGELVTAREASGSIKCRDISDYPEMVKYFICYCLPNRD